MPDMHEMWKRLYEIAYEWWTPGMDVDEDQDQYEGEQREKRKKGVKQEGEDRAQSEDPNSHLDSDLDVDRVENGDERVEDNGIRRGKPGMLRVESIRHTNRIRGWCRFLRSKIISKQLHNNGRNANVPAKAKATHFFSTSYQSIHNLASRFSILPLRLLTIQNRNPTRQNQVQQEFIARHKNFQRINLLTQRSGQFASS